MSDRYTPEQARKTAPASGRGGMLLEHGVIELGFQGPRGGHAE